MCFGGTASSRKSRGTGVRNTEIEWLEPLNSPIKNSRIPYHVFRFFFLSTVGGIKNIGGTVFHREGPGLADRIGFPRSAHIKVGKGGSNRSLPGLIREGCRSSVMILLVMSPTSLFFV